MSRKPTPMDHVAADRIAAAAATKTRSSTAASGFAERARAAADHNDYDDTDAFDDGD
jgi:hypothetical protein